jgi:pimeloyl-ACP methyl ester carboxylesterase
MMRPASLVLVAAVLASACVGNRSYREDASVLHEKLLTPEFEPRTNDPANEEYRLEWPYTLAFIEFDDRGEMFNRAQLTAATAAIAAAKAAATTQAAEIRTRMTAAGLALCDTRPRLCAPEPLVVTFVHGWKNNASEGSGNVWGFRQVLAGLSRQFTSEARRPLRAATMNPTGFADVVVPVVGVYIGWRGAVISAPVLKEFTFFDRHMKSQNVPNAHMVEAMLAVMQTARGRNFDEPAISVLVGHSFGGAVLETAITQPLMTMLLNAVLAPSLGADVREVGVEEAQAATRAGAAGLSVVAVAPGGAAAAAGMRAGDIVTAAGGQPVRRVRDLQRLVEAVPRGGTMRVALVRGTVSQEIDVTPQPAGPTAAVRWPATLTVLLNEAQEATRSFQLIEALHTNLASRPICPARSAAHNPAIISVSSSADYATRAFFPAAQSLIRPFNSLRTYEAENFLGLRRQTPTFLGTTAHLGAFRSHVMGPENDPEVAAAIETCPRPIVRTTIEDVTYNVIERPGAKNRTPYWVMHMPPSLVPDHSTIFTPAFRDFLTTMIYQMTEPYETTGL